MRKAYYFLFRKVFGTLGNSAFWVNFIETGQLGFEWYPGTNKSAREKFPFSQLRKNIN